MPVDFLPKMLGQSGAEVSVCLRDRERVVVKRAARSKAERLLTQARLQADYAASTNSRTLATPRVIETNSANFVMEFIDGEPLGEHWITASIEDVGKGREAIIRWIGENLSHAAPADHRARSRFVHRV